MKLQGSPEFSWVQICLFWLPGSSINLAWKSSWSGSTGRCGRCWALIKWLSFHLCFRFCVAQRESRSSKQSWFTDQLGWINIRPTLRGNTINSFLVRKCYGVPLFSSTTETEDTAHSWHLYPCRLFQILWGSGDQNLLSPVIQFNKAWEKEGLSAHRGKLTSPKEKKNSHMLTYDGDKSWLIGINLIISSHVYLDSSLIETWVVEKGGKCCLNQLIIPLFSCCWADNLSKSHCLSFTFSKVLCPHYFSVSLLIYLPKCSE